MTRLRAWLAAWLASVADALESFGDLPDDLD